MIHSVLAILSAVAIPFAASVRLPVVPAPANRMVSLAIAMVSAPAPFWLTNVIAAPIGAATLALLAIVNVRAVASADGCKMCLPTSARTVV